MHLLSSFCSSTSFVLAPEDSDVDLSFAACFSASFLVLRRLSSSLRSSVRLRSIAWVCSANAARSYKQRAVSIVSN